MSEVVEKLQAARDLVARPGGWTQGEVARDKAGKPTESRAHDAVCWCAFGALRAVHFGRGLTLLCKAIGHQEVANWNDYAGRTQAEVVAAFDRAIELARAAS